MVIGPARSKKRVGRSRAGDFFHMWQAVREGLQQRMTGAEATQRERAGQLKQAICATRMRCATLT